MDEKTLNALVNAIKNKDPKGLKAYENLQKIASSKPKNEEEQKNIEAAKGYVAEIKKRLTTKAAHGAKLDYVKSLKHICPEGEELVYFKQGGSVKCGCAGKKLEEGAKVEKANTSVEKFKAIKKGQKGPKDTLKFKDQAARDSFYINTHGAEDLESTRPGSYKKNKDGKVQWTPDRTKAPYNNQKTKKQERKREEPEELKVTRPKPGNKSIIVSSYQSSYLKQGDKVVDKFKAKCGSKMKKHKDGGSLNGIPFIRKEQ